VSIEELREIIEAVNGMRPVSAALGDAGDAGSLASAARAAAEGAMGVLVDTVRKDGAGLFRCLGRAVLGSLVREARARSLMVALAGRITVDDLAFAYEAGAEIVGVRGAACEHGREGRVRESRVRELVTGRDLLRVHRGDTHAIAREITRETSFR